MNPPGTVQSSLAWNDGTIVTLDQRALPHEIRQIRMSTVEEVREAIATLAIRGAPAIGLAGALAVALSARHHLSGPAPDPEAVRADAERLVAVRPTAVNLAWAVNRTLHHLPEGPEAVLAAALEMLDQDIAVNLRMVTHAVDAVTAVCPDTPLGIWTHCNTGRLATAAIGTALGTILALAETGRVSEVLVGETRPLLQGARLTTWELAEAGIPHRLCVDSAAATAMDAGLVDCVLVGADRIAANHDVANKIGTYALALAAHHHGVPFLVVAPESTRDATIPGASHIVVEHRPAHEITHYAGTPTAPASTRAFNPAFDTTPAHLITALISEDGITWPKGEQA
ncbi:S-methyl-5-thioribose-1-phosphate isomerase [Streptomyces sp. NPDC005547]|uniref:S-methyl-5-thioribose-1-phosphate isomerase n=1 Tax=Streptomyces sp. NPDC005547 TaxID=3154887 RepID=UPI0033AB76F9